MRTKRFPLRSPPPPPSPQVVVGVVGRLRWARELLVDALRAQRGCSPMDLGAPANLTAASIAATRGTLLVLDLAAEEAVAFTVQVGLANPEIAVVVIVVDASSDGALRGLLRAGVRGILHCEDGLEEVVRCLHAVRRGGVVLSPRVVGVLARSGIAPGQPSTSPKMGRHLTPREMQIVQLLGQGLQNKEIGARLGIGVGTVKNHVHRILAKLSVHHRWEVGDSTDTTAPAASSESRGSRDHGSR